MSKKYSKNSNSERFCKIKRSELGNEKMNRGKYKTMPEDIDIVIQEKFEEKKEEVNKHRENKTEEPTTQGDCIIF